MSARGFGSVLWAGAIAGAALGFYLVSLNVASERAELEQVETKIALAERDIRLLQTEIGTRGRLAQLERWNVKFIRLSAPSADQFVEGGFHLATLVAPQKKPVIEAPVVLASAPVGHAVSQQPRLTGDAVEAESPPPAPRAASEMLHIASYSAPPSPATPRRAAPQPLASKPLASSPAVTKSPVTKPAVNKPLPDKPSSAKPVAAKTHQVAAAMKPAKSAMVDPLSPLPSARPKSKGGAPPASAGAQSQRRIPKDSVTD